MTRDEAREFAKVVQAYADGKSVEYTNKNTEGWVSLCTADRHYWFDTEMFDYRIKPEPREWWVVPNAAHAAASKGEAECLAESMGWPTSSIVHVREVLP